MVVRNKEGHYIMIKKITIINMYAFNIRTPKYIKQILTDQKGEIDNK